MKRVQTAAGADQYIGVFSPGGNTAAEYDQVLTLATRLLTEVNLQAASQRMAADYDAKSKVHTYQLLDAVGVRIPGKNPRKGDTPNSLPGLVVSIHKQDNGSGSKKVVHQLYTVWCQYGVLSQKLKIDKLVSLSINNFPHLLAFRDETLTAPERLPQSDPDWQSALRGTARSCPKVTVDAAWKAHVATFQQRPVDQSRQRTVPTRLAADAADTAIAATRADNREALSFATITNQFASQSSSRPAASSIARILSANKTNYKVQWTQPEGNPAVSSVNKHWMIHQAAYRDVVNAHNAEQQEQQEQQ